VACYEPLDVGVRAINAIITVEKGQRMGLFAGSGLMGKSVLGYDDPGSRHRRRWWANEVEGREVKVDDILSEDDRKKSRKS
jgi:hypothetical protein